MKAIYKSLLAAVVATPMLTGCIEETFPTSGIVESQLESNPRATEALVWAMPGHLNQVGTISDQHWDIGYPGLMHIRDLFTADLHHSQLGANYNHFWSWSENSLGLGAGYLYPQFPWNWCYEQINICNKVISAIAPDTDNAELRMQLAAGHAYRAFTYLDFGRMYEALPTDGYDLAPEVVGLTLVIVDENTTSEQLSNNPRVTHEVLVDFIKSDLDKAIALSEGAAAVPSKTIPGLDVAYGLYARLLLWDATYQEEIKQDANAAANLYAEAKRYAELAIATHGDNITTREEWLSTTNGFNDASVASWMFCGQYVTEDTGAQAPNVSWTGWMASEKSYGYASTRLQCFPEIGAAVYNRIDNRDFRKLTFVAPEGTALSGQEPYLDAALAAEYFTAPYIGFKFRPGSGNTNDGKVGCAVAYPLMRVEEMHFIAMECEAHADPAVGKASLEKFMKTYRNSSYSTRVTSKEDVIEEIIFQKRVEFWGEGLSYFDIKRLDYPVTRAYDGTNFAWGTETMNTTRRPAWMNFVITNQEVNNNIGIPSDLNTPTPANCYLVLER